MLDVLVLNIGVDMGGKTKVGDIAIDANGGGDGAGDAIPTSLTSTCESLDPRFGGDSIPSIP